MAKKKSEKGLEKVDVTIQKLLRKIEARAKRLQSKKLKKKGRA